MATTLYFNEEQHKYTNNIGLTYTSMTTVIGKYENKFDVNKMAKQCHQRYFRKQGHRYYGMSVKQIKDSWNHLTVTAQDRGNDRHNWLEELVKDSSGYTKVGKSKFINDRIYTIEDILINHDFGEVDLSYFIKRELNIRYPQIYAILEWHVLNGWRIYSEIGVFNNDLMVSGLIDILLVKNTIFRILDWKTNKAKLEFRAGYYKRDNLGRNTSEWVDDTKKRFKAPLAHIPESKGNEYTLQLSGYAWLIEQFGLKLDILMLCHIRPKELNQYGNIDDDNKDDDIVDIVPIQYWSKDVEAMFKHHYRVYVDKQTNLFN